MGWLGFRLGGNGGKKGGGSKLLSDGEVGSCFIKGGAIVSVGAIGGVGGVRPVDILEGIKPALKSLPVSGSPTLSKSKSSKKS